MGADEAEPVLYSGARREGSRLSLLAGRRALFQSSLRFAADRSAVRLGLRPPGAIAAGIAEHAAGEDDERLLIVAEVAVLNPRCRAPLSASASRPASASSASKSRKVHVSG